MNYLLDTDALSALRRPDRLPLAVSRWFRDVGDEQLFLSVITWMELEIGIRRKERADPLQGEMLRRWKSERVAPAFDGRILAVTPSIAQTCAGLHVPDPKPMLDSLIAATAIVHGMAVLDDRLYIVSNQTLSVVDKTGQAVELAGKWNNVLGLTAANHKLYIFANEPKPLLHEVDTTGKDTPLPLPADWKEGRGIDSITTLDERVYMTIGSDDSTSMLFVVDTQ